MKKRKINRAKLVDSHCKNNGKCNWCRDSRTFQARKEVEKAEYKEPSFYIDPLDYIRDS